jgi:hypothetical protein
MFGFGKSKTEKTVLKLERVMMAIEDAYEKGKYDIARAGVHEQTRVLRWLHIDGEWSEEQIGKFLEERGLVRSVSDEEYCSEIAMKLQVF